MAREVFVCIECGEQGAEQWGYCKKCGPVQVMCLDDWARKQEQPKEAEVEEVKKSKK